MVDDRTDLDRVIEDLQRMEHQQGPESAAGGMLHAARTILQELARVTEFGGGLNDEAPGE